MGFLEVKTFLLTDKSSINKINYNGSLIEAPKSRMHRIYSFKTEFNWEMLGYIWGEQNELDSQNI